MANKVMAAVAVAPKKTEIRELDMPELTPDSGLLKIEAAGVCGSDWPMYQSERPGPRILGHENVGYIAKIGSEAAKRWGVKEGDRVALEEYLPCGHCRLCRSGEFRSCQATDIFHNERAIRFGSTPLTVKPSLWGGYSQYLYLHPSTVIHKISNHVPAEQAALALPLSNGIEWAMIEGGVKSGKVVVIQGPGQQGLGCVVAAKTAGASCIIVSGLTRDEQRLRVAKLLGADYTVDAEKEDLLERVKEITGGEMADVSINVASGSEVTIKNAIEVAKKRGTAVFAASNKKPLTSFNMDAVISKHLTVKGVRGHSFDSVEMAIQAIESKAIPLAEMCTHHYGLEQVDEALRTVGGEINPGAIHVTVNPWS